ncbi:uncharacterized protein LOC134187099 [Corticium candelabrum]|uniref:uncharacterized protein LOC134187099 n=1 Tax=Corticium candelabrum TaxID=121492 RepID=UPI002E27680B|nr:uncharacterized protein LOC134187099 [Corticium candelabrum]
MTRIEACGHRLAFIYLCAMALRLQQDGTGKPLCKIDNRRFQVEYSKYEHPLRCNATCGERCEMNRLSNNSYLERCFCDKFCKVYGDCCLGLIHSAETEKILFHLKFQNDSQTLMCVNPVNLLKNVSERVKVIERIRQAYESEDGVYMKTSCSSTWYDDEWRVKIRERCENVNASLHVSNGLQLTPVSTSDITYRNVYCAICNHQNASEYTFWKTGLYCDDRIVNYLDNTFNGNVTIERIEQSCSIAYFQQPNVTSRWLDPFRQCHTRTIDHCLPYDQLTNLMTIDHYNCLKSRCLSYTDRVSVSLGPCTNRIYKNIDCAECNGLGYRLFHITRLPPGVCGEIVDRWIPERQITPFPAILNINDNGRQSFSDGWTTTELTKSCGSGQVFNIISKRCQDLYSPINFELASGICVPLKPNIVSVRFNLTLMTDNSKEIAVINNSELSKSISDGINFALHNELINATVRKVNITTINGFFQVYLVINMLNDNETIDSILSIIHSKNFLFQYGGSMYSVQSGTVMIWTPRQENDLECDAYIALNESEYQQWKNDSIFGFERAIYLQYPNGTNSSDRRILVCNYFSQTYNKTVTVAKHAYLS